MAFMGTTEPPGRGAIRRWDLYWVDLGPVVGSEQGGSRRPGLILSNDAFNEHFPIVTVIPLTGIQNKRRRVYPFEVILDRGSAGNPQDSIAMPQQIRTISKTRLGARIGALRDPDVRARIEARLLDHLGIESEFAAKESDS
jgi:mRNA-degrading endonuclease toxin of MazEF toxin-antitoxin module